MILNRLNCFWLGVSLGLLIMLGIAVFGDARFSSVWHTRIIEQNCGQYNSQSGKFEWLNPKKDEKEGI